MLFWRLSLKEYSVEFPSVADAEGVVWNFVAPWTVTWTTLASESVYIATHFATVYGQEEEITRIDKSTSCPNCALGNKFSDPFCCSFGDPRAEGTADMSSTMSHHCLTRSDKWDIHSLEHDRTRYAFKVHISRPRLNTDGFMETVESTWYVHADGVEHVVTVPEEDDTSSDDTSSLDYLSHSEVMAMVPPGFSGRHFLVPAGVVSHAILGSVHFRRVLQRTSPKSFQPNLRSNRTASRHERPIQGAIETSKTPRIRAADGSINILAHSNVWCCLTEGCATHTHMSQPIHHAKNTNRPLSHLDTDEKQIHSSCCRRQSGAPPRATGR